MVKPKSLTSISVVAIDDDSDDFCWSFHNIELPCRGNNDSPAAADGLVVVVVVVVTLTAGDQHQAARKVTSM